MKNAMGGDAARHERNKRLIWNLWQAQEADPVAALETLAAACRDDLEIYAFYPLKRVSGLDRAIKCLWAPWLRAMPGLRRRADLLLAGSFAGGDWVASAGELAGEFAADWLGIPAHGQRAAFRYGEFCKIQDGKIAEIRLLIDLPALIRQADRAILPPSYGQDIRIPGPGAGDGLWLGARDSAESAKTLTLVEEMIFGGLNNYDQRSQDSQCLERFWSADLAWHGPVGIGSAFGLDDFKRDAQGPIVRAFPDRKGVGHQARIAEGLYAASTGWPSLVGTHRREFLGWPPTGETARWDIMDFWRRDGALLRENWVLIDLIAAALESGVELYPALAAHIPPERES